MSDEPTKDELAYQTRVREITEDGTELLRLTIAQWQAEGRMDSDLTPLMASISANGVSALLSNGQTFLIPISDPSRAVLK